MSKKQIEKHLEARLLRRVAPPLPRLVAATVEVEPLLSHIEFWSRLRIEVTIGAQVEGPDAALPHMRKEVVSGIVQELYGDIHHKLWDLRMLMYEEAYRSEDSPVIKKLDELLEDTRP